MRITSVGRALLALGFVGSLVVACAKGTDTLGVGGNGAYGGGTTNPSTGSGGMPEAGPSGMLGSPCKSNADCTQGSCSPIGNASYCTQPCPPDCPEGTYCTLINGTALCAPDLDQECLKCNATTDCKLPSDACLTAPLGDKFCARDCTLDGVCPNGFTCLDMGSYAGDGGTPDAGDPDAGADAPYKWCVPNSGFSCPCNAKRDGVNHLCTVKNQYGTCSGAEICNGAKGQWQGCTAKTPAAESCNGMDDDCNGMADDGDPNALCSSQGPQPPHSTWACNNGTCSLGACDPGWTSYPAGPASQGCNCQLEPGEPNGTCGAATNAGMVTDTGGTITIQGTLSSAVDVDVWSFDAIDVDEGTTNSYHVAIAFTQPAPNDEFLMDVMRGDPCTDTPTGPSTGIVAYDWCVNGGDGTIGEGSCGPTGTSHCGGGMDGTSSSHTAKYYVRIYRRAGATGTCAQYQLTVSGGGGTCDFTKKCP